MYFISNLKQNNRYLNPKHSTKVFPLPFSSISLVAILGLDYISVCFWLRGFDSCLIRGHGKHLERSRHVFTNHDHI